MARHLVVIFASVALIAFTSRFSREGAKRIEYLAPPEQIKYFHLGYSESLSDAFWIRLVQDFSVCEQNLKTKPSDQVRSNCDKGWVFQMLDRITELAPRFRLSYVLGATNLSVLVDDREGARVIFEKGLRQYPNDWLIAYRAAYHYLIEMKEAKRAADLLVIAGKNGAPSWVFSLAGRLYSDEGQAFLAKTVLKDALRQDPKGPGAERIRERLAEAEKTLAKSRQGRDSAQ